MEELERTMSASEYAGWAEYLSTIPSTQELQMARLLYIQHVKAGDTNVKVEDFLIAKEQRESQNGVGIDAMTAEDINKLAGVTDG